MLDFLLSVSADTGLVTKPIFALNWKIHVSEILCGGDAIFLILHLATIPDWFKYDARYQMRNTVTSGSR
jgi:hypothetical protein